MNLAAAIRERDPAQLPGKRDEDWRWTDLRGLIRVVPEPSAPFEGEITTGPWDGLAKDRRWLLNGRGDQHIEVGVGQEAVVGLRWLSRGAGSHAGRTTVNVAEGGKLVLLEAYESDAGSVAHAALDVKVATGASLERLVLTADDAEAVSVSQAEVTLAPGARFAQTVLASGARRQRIETRLHHPGGGADVRIDAVYLLADKRHADLTSAVTHEGVEGVTQQLTKGVVRDQSRGVFQGRIIVAEGADRTDARMGHHALILSDRAEVDAKPELEIYADDVSCAHGNTVGALDEDALFYAEQRGIPADEARAMLTLAFVGEVVDRIEHQGARDLVRTWVAERLG